MKRKKNNLFQKIALGLIFSLGFFALFNILGTAKAEETAEEQQITEEENIEDINFEGINTTEEIISEGENTPGEEFNQVEGIKYNFFPSTILVSENDSEEPSILMASVAIENTEIIFQNNNNLKISFDLVNKNSWTQNNIRYKVALSPVEFFTKASPPLSKDEGSKTEIFFEANKLYPEKISLKKNSRINKIVEYEAPSYLSGDYLLFIGTYLPVGLPLGMKILTETPISLKGDNQFVEIIPSSCQFFTEVKSGDESFQKEGQIAICEAINHSKRTVEFTPYFEIYQRSEYGEKIKEFISDRGTFHFEPGEKQNISFDLPIDLNPQSYSAKIILRENEKDISNQITLDYTVEGLSATIQNVIFDKDNYKKGETAKVRLFWSDTPKLFEERAYIEYLQAELIFKDGETSQICGQVTKDLDVEKNYEEIPITIEKNCPNPIILASLKNKEDKILFQQESQILEEKGSNFFYSGKNVSKDKNYILIFTLIAISAVALIIFLILFIKMNKIKNII
jgi:hypothetical protein